MKIAVRMDDITPDMDWQAFERVIALLEANHAMPLLGIVPDNQDENLMKEEKHSEFWSRMKELEVQGAVMALHGWHHIYTTKKGGRFPLNHFSEFAGIPYEKQREMIAEGKEILHQNGIDTTIFMAPAHSYDKNTIRALKENGFDKITDGFGEAPYFLDGITYYPISFRMEDSLKKETGYTTMVLHANTMTEADFETFEKRMKQADLISYAEYLKVSAIKASFGHRLKEYFLASLKHLLVSIKSR